MNWISLQGIHSLKLTHFEKGRIPEETRLILAQEVPVLSHRREEFGDRVALVLADLMILPNIRQVDPVRGELRRRGRIAIAPLRPHETLWTPDSAMHGHAIPLVVEGPQSHPEVDRCLREWRLPYREGAFTVGRTDRQRSGADMGVETPNQDFNVQVVSRATATVDRRQNQLFVHSNNPGCPLYFLKQGLWKAAPETGPNGLPLATTSTIVPYSSVIDRMEELDRERVLAFYGVNPFSAAWKRFLLKWQNQKLPEELSPWIGASTSLVKR